MHADNFIVHHHDISSTTLPRHVMLRPHAFRQSIEHSHRHVRSAVLRNVSTHANAERHGGRLSGKTIGIKDNIAVSDAVTSAGSRMLKGYKSPYDATVVHHLRVAEATILPGLPMDEFGMGSHSQFDHSGPVASPYTRNGEALSPGGSSGGSAVAVAKEDCWAALGTDTGGSVRLPAAYTGVIGFKPSYGRLSRWGVIQYANSLDTVGILAREVSAVREVYECLNKFDKQDPTSLPGRVRSRVPRQKPERNTSIRIGIPREYNIAEISPEVRRTYLDTLRRLKNAGHTLVPVSLPSTRLALSAYYVLAPAEASSNLAKYDGVRYGFRNESSTEINGSTKDLTGLAAPSQQTAPLYASTRFTGFGEEVRRRILLGAYTLSSDAKENYFIQAQRVRRIVQRDFDAVFDLPNPLHLSSFSLSSNGQEQPKVDVLLTPTAPTLPPTLEEVKKATSVEHYMNDVFTVPASLAGLPAISLPVDLSAAPEGAKQGDFAKMGVQVIGQFGDDAKVLGVAEMLEGLVKASS